MTPDVNNRAVGANHELERCDIQEAIEVKTFYFICMTVVVRYSISLYLSRAISGFAINRSDAQKLTQYIRILYTNIFHNSTIVPPVFD